MPKDIVDTIGRELKVGDIVQYSTANRSSVCINFGVVERFQSPKDSSYARNKNVLKIKIARIEKKHWDTLNGQWRDGCKTLPQGLDEYLFKSSLLNSAHSLTVINDLKLPDDSKFNALRQKSKELSYGSSEN